MAYDPLDEYRRRQKFLDDALGGGAVGRVLKEMQERERLMLPASRVLDQIARSTRVDREILASVSRVRDQHEQLSATARAAQGLIDRHLKEIVENQRRYEELSASGVLDRIYEQHRRVSESFSALASTHAKAFDVARWANEYGLLERSREVAQALNAATRFSANNSVTTELSVGLELDAAATLQTALDAAIVEFEEDVQSDERFSLSKIFRMIERLWLLYSIITALMGQGYNTEDRARDERTAHQVEQNSKILRSQQKAIECILADCLAAVEADRLNSLPRGFVKSAANVRAGPAGSAPRIARLGQDVPVAIEERVGGWRHVKFSDPLTGQLAEGWVWHTSIEELKST